MASESIQTSDFLRHLDGSVAERVARWAHVAEAFGIPLTADQLAALLGLSDLEASHRVLPHLSDVERGEVLWAVAPTRTSCGRPGSC